MRLVQIVSNIGNYCRCNKNVPEQGPAKDGWTSRRRAAPADPGALSALLKHRELQQLPGQPVRFPSLSTYSTTARGQKCKALTEHCQCHQTSTAPRLGTCARRCESEARVFKIRMRGGARTPKARHWEPRSAGPCFCRDASVRTASPERRASSSAYKDSFMASS